MKIKALAFKTTHHRLFTVLERGSNVSQSELGRVAAAAGSERGLADGGKSTIGKNLEKASARNNYGSTSSAALLFQSSLNWVFGYLFGAVHGI